MEHVEGLPRYTYQPWEEGYMRVLVLEPGTFGTPLHGQLVPVRIPSERYDDDEHDEDYGDDGDGEDEDQSSPSAQYEAISYAWGSVEFSHHITLGEGGILGITLSLYQALQRFRDSHVQRTLWADAICINQNDKHEKSSQVARMAQIYKQARRTLVCLGESQGLDWLAFGLFAVIQTRKMSVQDLGRALFDLRQSCTCCPDVRIANASAAIQLAAQAVDALFARPWFERLWVVQEYALSREAIVHCGTHSYSAHRCFYTLCSWHGTHSKESPFSSNTLGIVANMPGVTGGSEYPRDETLLELLRDVSARVCTDARDRIFAIKDLCEARAWSEVVPDYEIKPATLYARTVSRCLVGSPFTYHPTVLMAFATATRALHGGPRDLPSWVPDFQRLDHDLSESIWQRYKPRIDTKVPDKASVSMGRTPLELRVDGVMCGNVKQTLSGSKVSLIDRVDHGIHLFVGPSVFTDRERLLRWLRECGQFMLGFHGRGKRGKAFYRAFDPSGIEEYWWVLISTLIAMEDVGYGQVVGGELEEVITSLAEGALASLIGPGRLFSVIESDTVPQFGWVPADTKQGDELWFIKGGLWPLVLRRIPESDAYQLIGDAAFPHLFTIHKDSKYGEQNAVYIR